MWKSVTFLLLVLGAGSPGGSSRVEAEALSNTVTAPRFHPIERMKVNQYRLARKEGNPRFLDRPILIEQALSLEDCEDICSHLVQLAGGTEIQVQQKLDNDILFHRCSLYKAFDLMMESSPSNSFFAFVEGILSRDGTDDGDSQMYSRVQQPLTRAREALFEKDDLGTPGPDSVNWFDYFPEGAKPSDCMILAGQGATSTFHRDPFEWTGSSLCLEGRKIWRFVKPKEITLQGQQDDDSYHREMNNVKRVDDLLHAYRLESIAWDAEDSRNSTLVLSAGWQSDLSLFHKVDENVPSARELDSMDAIESYSLLRELATSSSLLGPNLLIKGREVEQSVDGFYSTVQQQGDLLLIPAHWYHQTYAPEPSMAVASQRCGASLDAQRVFRHILSQQEKLLSQNVPAPLKLSEKEFANHNDPEALVNELFAFLMSCNNRLPSL